MEHDITFDGIIGVSAGAAFGVNYKSHQIGRGIRYNKRFAHDPRYCSFFSLLTTGDLYGAQFDYYTVPQELDPFDYEAFERDPTEFYVVATDVDSGEAEYRRLYSLEGDGMEWVRASASMPIAAQPVELEGHKYLDGGIVDSLPIRWFESIGYTKNVVILTQPADYIKNTVRGSSILELVLHEYPKVSNALNNLPDVYNADLQHIREQEAAGNAFVFRPDETLQIGKLAYSRTKMEDVYEIGRANAERRLPELLEFLKTE